MTSTYGDTHDERARELAGIGTSVRRTGKGVLADLREALGLSAEGSLTRAEDAYAHLASFARGDAVDIESTRACYRAVVMTPLRADGDDLASAYLVVSSDGTPVTITVASLLDSRRAVTGRRGGNVRYFDEAGYAAQNG